MHRRAEDSTPDPRGDPTPETERSGWRDQPLRVRAVRALDALARLKAPRGARFDSWVPHSLQLKEIQLSDQHRADGDSKQSTDYEPRHERKEDRSDGYAVGSRRDQPHSPKGWFPSRGH